MDERNWQIALRVIAFMYFLTIFLILGIVFYRQFFLGQEMSEFEDIAIVMTINSLFLVSALLYFGAIQFQRLKVKSILLIYIGFVLLGFLFTYVKYNVLQSPGLSFEQLFDKLIIIASVSGLIMAFWIVFSVLGKKRVDKELE